MLYCDVWHRGLTPTAYLHPRCRKRIVHITPSDKREREQSITNDQCVNMVLKEFILLRCTFFVLGLSMMQIHLQSRLARNAGKPTWPSPVWSTTWWTTLVKSHTNVTSATSHFPSENLWKNTSRVIQVRIVTRVRVHSHWLRHRFQLGWMIVCGSLNVMV